MPSANIDPADSWHYYRKHSKLRKVANTRRPFYHRRITSYFWGLVATNLIEKKAGVLVNNLGYFCISMVPVKQIPYKKAISGRYLNPHTESRVYFPVLITSKTDKLFNLFNMDRSFSKKIRDGINRKLKDGFKYINMYKEINLTFIDRYRKNKNR